MLNGDDHRLAKAHQERLLKDASDQGRAQRPNRLVALLSRLFSRRGSEARDEQGADGQQLRPVRKRQETTPA